jgi:hypothetical protein
MCPVVGAHDPPRSQGFIGWSGARNRYNSLMFGFKKKPPEIDVEFYERGQLIPFARASVPIDQLPDTFEIETALTIQDEEWRVSNARPLTKEEFRKAGWLQVFLYKPVFETVSSDKVSFSLPTISNDIAGLEQEASLENILVVHEDDWRQQEFVSRVFAGEIIAEMDSIGLIYQSRTPGGGFKECHLRSSIPSPFQNVRLTLNDLMSRLGCAHVYRGAAFSNVAAKIRNGFAFQSEEGPILWGQIAQSGEISALCLQFSELESHDLSRSSPFDSLLADYELYFVDWVHLLALPPLNE